MIDTTTDTNIKRDPNNYLYNSDNAPTAELQRTCLNEVLQVFFISAVATLVIVLILKLLKIK
jgi:hypothetical protein